MASEVTSTDCNGSDFSRSLSSESGPNGSIPFCQGKGPLLCVMLLSVTSSQYQPSASMVTSYSVILGLSSLVWTSTASYS